MKSSTRKAILVALLSGGFLFVGGCAGFLADFGLSVASGVATEAVSGALGLR